MPTAVYLRKSRTEEQNEPVEATLRRHREQLLEFAEINALSIADIYEEVVSGETLCSRPQMLRLLSALEAGRYDAVLCMDIDRLGRGSMSDQGVILETFKRAGARIITPRRTYDLRDELDETYSEFETFMARQELKQIKRRLNRGLQKTVRDGGYVANAPYGYRKAVSGRLPTLTPDEEEARFVRMIFDLYVRQGVGTYTIAETISDLGAKPRRGDRFSRGTIRKILKNPVYIGQIVWNRTRRVKGSTAESSVRAISNPPEQWTRADGLHPAIIATELFARAQEILSGHGHPPHFDGTVSNPFAGLIRCGNCGGLMQRRVCGGSVRRAYLVCQKSGCIPSARLEPVEEVVLAFLRKRLEAVTFEPRPSNSSGDIPRDTARAIARERAKLGRQHAALHDLLEQGVYDTDTFLARRAALETSLSRLDTRESALGAGMQAICAPAECPSNLYAAYLAADARIKNELLKAIVRKIIYYKAPDGKQYDFTLFLELNAF